MCGYKKCIRALSFHHRDPTTKQFGLEMRSIRGLGWESVLAEAEKCDLLCLNCHMETEDAIAKENGKYYKQVGRVGLEPTLRFPSENYEFSGIDQLTERPIT